MEILQTTSQDLARTQEFYRTVSTLCFTLLGLWWVVIQLRYKDSEGDPQARRHAYSVLLFFLLPGLMSLFSVVDDSSTWWRIVFGVTALVGMLEILLYYQSRNRVLPSADRALRGVALVDYVLIALVAIRPALAKDLSLGITGLQLEAILVALLFIVGIHMVFLAITGRAETEETQSRQ